MSLVQSFNSYTAQIPNQLLIKTAQSFCATAAISLFMGSRLSVAALGGGIAAVTAVVVALTIPIIKATFPDNPFLAQFSAIVMASGLMLGLTDRASALVGIAYKTVSPLLSFLACLALNDDWYRENKAIAVVF
jgi:hypothetical protein